MEHRVPVALCKIILISAYCLVIGADVCQFGTGCTFPCHCKNNATCDPLDGSCPDGCDDVMIGEDGYSGGPWSDYGCQLGNIAFGEFVEGSILNDGDLGGCQLIYNELIDMAAQYVIKGFNFTTRGSPGYCSIIIHPGSYEPVCRPQEDLRGNERSFNCVTPIVEDRIYIYSYNDWWFCGDICEVMVFGYLYLNCSDDYFGIACRSPCNCQNACDDISGFCADGACLDGWVGDDCQTMCEPGMWGNNCTEMCHCRNPQEICRHNNGSCLSGCPNGYGGTGCNYVICIPGTWGKECGQVCNCRNEAEACHFINGACVSGCPDGYEGDGCNLVCEPGMWGNNCKEMCHCRNPQEICRRNNGYCLSGCPNGYVGTGCNLECTPGTWGAECGQVCNCRIDTEVCHHINGACMSGCPDGYVGDGCNLECEPRAWGSNCMETCRCKNPQEICNHINGFCLSGCPDGYMGIGWCNLACRSGTWGARCGEHCNCRNETEVCHHINGTCVSGCPDGYEGDRCNFECTLGTWGAKCGQVCNCRNETEVCHYINGACVSGCADGYVGDGCNLECEPWAWGSNCMETCRCKNPQEICNHINGFCLSDCPDGYMGIGWCNLACRSGTWGARCGELCNCRNETEVCHHINGGCVSGCPDGYGGDGCNLGITESSTTTATVAVVVTLLVVTMIAVSVVIYLRRRRCCKVAGSNNTADSVHVENTYDYIDMEIHQQPNLGDTHSTPSSLNATRRPIQVTELDALLKSMFQSKDYIMGEYQNMQFPPKPKLDDVRQSDRNSADGSENEYESLQPISISVVGTAPDDIAVAHLPKYGKSLPGAILSRGDLVKNREAFWNNVWQSGSNRIILFETQGFHDETLSTEYYQNSTVSRAGKLSVTVTRKDTYGNIILCSLIVQNEDESRHVTEFIFTDWPANGVPPVATPLVNFHRRVHSHDKTAAGPLIVCSGSNSEDGGSIFLVLDYLVAQAKSEGVVDLVKCISQIQDKCEGITISLEQYVFLYHAVAEEVLSKETAMSPYELEKMFTELQTTERSVVANKMKQQYELLEKLKSTCSIAKSSAAFDRGNTSKNRERSIVPAEGYRPMLISNVDGNSDYINAVIVNGYMEPGAYVATQWPFPGTIVDIWRLMLDHKYSCIVSLEEKEPNDETMPVYWPTEKENPLLISQLKVDTTGSQMIEYGVLQMYEFQVFIKRKGSHTTRMYQFLDWPKEAETPSSAENILKLFEQCQLWQRHSGLGGIVFLCKSGYKRSGLLIAASYMLEVLKLDHVVDAFQAVRMARVPRPEFIPSLAQYRFLYDLAMTFIRSNEDYANFK